MGPGLLGAAFQRRRTGYGSPVTVVTANLRPRCKVAQEGNGDASETGGAYA